MSEGQLRQLSIAVGHKLKNTVRGWPVQNLVLGWVAKALTDIAGSSAYFDRGFVTYSNAAKQDLLGVSETTLARYGAVSEAVVREMALGHWNKPMQTLPFPLVVLRGLMVAAQINR